MPNYAMQAGAPCLIVLVFAVVVVRLYRDRKIGRRGACVLGPVLVAAFVLFAHTGWSAVRAIDTLRHLDPGTVQALAFYDEQRALGPTRPHDPAWRTRALEVEVTDPATISAFVRALRATDAYAPNHEGARDRYLVHIVRRDGDLWFVLGRGTRNDPRIAWVELNSHIGSGWHYGVYVDRPLFEVVSTRVGLSRWRAASPTTSAGS